MGKIAARIESPHDGEALAAARMLIKRLGGRGFRIAEIIEGGLVAADASHRPKSPRFSQKPSPPPRPHRVKIDALLGDALFTSEYLTRRSVRSLKTMRQADYLDPIEMSWVDSLLEKAREMRGGGPL
ncbi:hypothetical protein [Sphingobium indicum]